MTKQKVVLKVSMNGLKSRSKVMKIAVGVPGVESAALEGDDKNQLVVTGEGIDSVALTTLIRKSVGYTELVSVTPIDGKDETESEPWVQPMVWSSYQVGEPQYYLYGARNTNQDYCIIM